MKRCANCGKKIVYGRRFVDGYVVCDECYQQIMDMVREVGSVDAVAEELAMEQEVETHIGRYA
uniref:Uncharacterized protein n=1 Tax=viral metagenome TaxID=1070528 RepID=A0A6M3LL46_9ZZZZ